MKPLALRDKSETRMTQDRLESTTVTPDSWSDQVTDKIAETHHKGRLILGIKRSSKMIQKNPQKVLSCIIPTDSNPHGTSHLFQLMLEALCHTTGIPVVKIDSSVKFNQILTPSQRQADFDCAVMMASQDDHVFTAAIEALLEDQGYLPVANLR